MAQHITATVATRGRYDTTLPQTLAAIAAQTRQPDELWIVDDNPPEQRKNLLEHPVIAPILGILNTVTKTLIVEGKRSGPHINHEVARLQAKDLVWRVDDDEIPEPEVLQALEAHLISDKKVGAAAGLVPVPPHVIENTNASCAIEDFFDCKNVQWYNWPSGKIFTNAGHLHSTYLYRKDAATYRTDLSPVGHCEETFHSMEMVRNGFALVVDTNVKTWHCRHQDGGIRTHTNQEYYKSDWEKFVSWAKTLPFKFNRTCNVIAMHGQGDVFAALTASQYIIDFQRKHGNRVRFICRPADMPLFAKYVADDVTVCTPEQASQFELRHDGGIYAWMLRDKFSGGLVNAFRHYYTGGYPTWLGY